MTKIIKGWIGCLLHGSYSFTEQVIIRLKGLDWCSFGYKLFDKLFSSVMNNVIANVCKSFCNYTQIFLNDAVWI